MKEHGIIPIFIPHQGCPNDCVFCNQKYITSREEAPDPASIRKIIEVNLTTMANLKTTEIAFFGGSFTGLSIEEQNTFLDIALEYPQIDEIRLSTRPDYIDHEILDNLKRHSVKTIELGVQSFDEEVLDLSKRGHSVQDVFKAVDLIRDYGFKLGIQLMIGLPGDSKEKSIKSAKQAIKLSPDVMRLYPTLVLENTDLYRLYKSGLFTPFSEDLMIETTKEMYKVIYQAGIKIIRVGLKSTDTINSSIESYHPAFRELVESEIILENVEAQLRPILAKDPSPRQIILKVNPVNISRLVGHGGMNKKALGEKYPHISFKFCGDHSISNSLNSVLVQVSDRPG